MSGLHAQLSPHEEVALRRIALGAVDGCPPAHVQERTNYLREVAEMALAHVLGKLEAALPMQLPIKFEMVVNSRTAKMLGLTLSPLLLARADEVIE